MVDITSMRIRSILLLSKSKFTEQPFYAWCYYLYPHQIYITSGGHTFHDWRHGRKFSFHVDHSTLLYLVFKSRKFGDFYSPSWYLFLKSLKFVDFFLPNLIFVTEISWFFTTQFDFRSSRDWKTYFLTPIFWPLMFY